MRNRLYAIIFAIFALALASCSGGNSAAVAPEPHMTTAPAERATISTQHAAMPARPVRPDTAGDTWVDGTGNWSVPSNWSNGTPAPNADVVIDNNPNKVANVTLDVPATVNSLTLNADDSFTQASGQTLTMSGSSIANSGKWTIDNALLGMSSPPVTLSGGGTMTMTGSNADIAFGTSFDNVDNVIQGSGAIGSGTIGLHNSGTIRASGGTLTVQSNNSGFANSGTLEAAAGGTLVNYSPTTTQTSSGITEALNGGAVQLHATVVGGTVKSMGSGSVQVVAGSSATLDGVTLIGNYEVLSAGTTTLVHTITNKGTIALDSTGGGTPLSIQGTVTLKGSGKVKMSNNPDNFISNGGNAQLVNHNTISGSGGINVPFDNLATIDANQTTPLTVSAVSTQTNVNGKLMEATSGGTLSLIGGTLDNHAGTITAQAGSQVAIADTIRGGMLTTAGSGAFLGQSGTLDGKSSTITSNGTVAIAQSFSLNAQGTIVNNGQVTVTSTGPSTLLILTDSLTLDGTGHVVLAGGTIVGQSGQTLANHNTIQGKGTITGMAVQNAGTILANVSSAQLTVSPSSPGLTSSGAIGVSTGSTLQVNGQFQETTGTVTADGALSTNSGLTIQGGKLLGKGSFSGDVTSSGVVMPGDAVNQTGIFTLTGNYTQNASGELDVSIGGRTLGSQYDRLAVSSTAALGGTLRIALVSGFVPAIGNTFQIVTAASRSNTFSTVIGSGINSTRHFQVVYQSNGVQLKVLSGR
jgi:hypothetical protein